MKNIRWKYPPNHEIRSDDTLLFMGAPGSGFNTIGGMFKPQYKQPLDWISYHTSVEKGKDAGWVACIQLILQWQNTINSPKRFYFGYGSNNLEVIKSGRWLVTVGLIVSKSSLMDRVRQFRREHDLPEEINEDVDYDEYNKSDVTAFNTMWNIQETEIKKLPFMYFIDVSEMKPLQAATKLYYIWRDAMLDTYNEYLNEMIPLDLEDVLK